ncbi:MAG: Ni/Fe hydrogenase subunit alpha [Desulfobacterales bacterium]
MKKKSIQVNQLARVEGEGAFTLHFDATGRAQAYLNVFEAPRLFEGFLKGRHFTEVPDLTARICGICPVAHQIGAAVAIENSCGVSVAPGADMLRRIMLCGEWIESHALHVYLLHAPDYLKCTDGFGLAGATGDSRILERGLRLKKVGNDIVARIGGREIHPVNLRVGGFYRAPSSFDLAPLADRLKWALEAACETVRWVAGLEYPEFDREYTYVALSVPGAYPMFGDRLVSNRGLDVGTGDFERHFQPRQVPQSTALFYCLSGSQSLITGPLARFNIGANHLSPAAERVASENGLTVPCCNPFKSILVRSVELVHACETALNLVRTYRPDELTNDSIAVVSAVGHGAVEAPRGVLYHRYELDGTGRVASARIVTPTALNLAAAQEDLKGLARQYGGLPRKELTCLCEQAIRNYDPCISCATH